jgi:hypothetical protein
MHMNPRKRESGRFGSFGASDGLRRELMHLRDLGYIEIDGIRQLPATGEELTNYHHAHRTRLCEVARVIGPHG